VKPPTLRFVLAIVFFKETIRQKLSSGHGIANVQYEGQTSQGSNQNVQYEGQTSQGSNQNVQYEGQTSQGSNRN